VERTLDRSLVPAIVYGTSSAPEGPRRPRAVPSQFCEGQEEEKNSGQNSGQTEEEVVTLHFASWNQIREWLRRLQALRHVPCAAPPFSGCSSGLYGSSRIPPSHAMPSRRSRHSRCSLRT
jgi:hypothetical protein